MLTRLRSAWPIALRTLLIGGLLGSAVFLAAAPAVPSLQVSLGGNGDSKQLGASLQILILMTVLSLAPAFLILTTAFTRIVIVLSFVRTALGTQAIPPNQVIVGLSLFLTFFVMEPTYREVDRVALTPMAEGKIDAKAAMARAEAPMREFMLRHTYERDLALFLDLRGEKPAKPEDVKFLTLVPAFVVSELKTAFIIGFYIFIPFVIIDLIVASLLMGMGMMMMPPVVISLPAKLLVFVLADGWTVLIRALVSGYM